MAMALSEKPIIIMGNISKQKETLRAADCSGDKLGVGSGKDEAVVKCSCCSRGRSQQLSTVTYNGVKNTTQS